MNKPTITPADITAACAVIARNPADYRSSRPLPTTAKRHDQRLLADGRNAIAQVILATGTVRTYQQLTAAIRRGHNGDATDFTAINRQGVIALGYTFSH